MFSRNHTALVTLVVAALMLTAQGAAAQATYTLTVMTDKPSYITGQTIKVTGSVSPAPGPSTAVFVKVLNPGGKIVVVGNAPVGANSGLYNFSLVAGGSPDWTVGTYKVNATWGAYPPTKSQATTFGYSAPTTTTTTSTTSPSTTSTSSSTTSSSSTSTSTVSSTSSSTSSTTSTSPPSTSTTSTSTSTPSSSSSGGGGIPEFPYQAVFAGALIMVITAAYLLARRSVLRGPGVPSTR